MQISEIKMAEIPDVDLSQLGTSKFGKFTVEVVDPVSDYLELMEVFVKYVWTVFYAWHASSNK